MVSIVIPAYNTEKYIRECLDSALGQTYSDIELVIVDDGSTDSTPSIIRSYAARDSRVKIITQPNSGLSAARNRGVDEASGDWVTFLDSDDALYTDAVSVMLGLAGQSSCNIVYGGFSEGTQIGETMPKSRTWTCSYDEAMSQVLYQKGLLCSACGKLYRKELLQRHRFRDGILYEDLDFFYRVAEGQTIAVTSALVYFYRIAPASITTVFTPRRFDVLEATRRIEEYMTEHHPQLLPAARDRRLSANFNMFGLIAAHTSAADSGDDATASTELYSATASTELYSATADSCWQLIKSYRLASLLNPRVRLKNKLGIIASYLGRPVVKMLSKKVYGRKLR